MAADLQEKAIRDEQSEADELLRAAEAEKGGRTEAEKEEPEAAEAELAEASEASEAAEAVTKSEVEDGSEAKAEAEEAGEAGSEAREAREGEENEENEEGEAEEKEDEEGEEDEVDDEAQHLEAEAEGEAEGEQDEAHEEAEEAEEAEEVQEEADVQEAEDEEIWEEEEVQEESSKAAPNAGGAARATVKESWPSLPGRPAPRRWTGRPQESQNGAVPNGVNHDGDLHSQLRHLEEENEDLKKELSNEKMRVKQLQKLQVEAAQANHREFEAKKREASALRELEEAKAYVARRHTFALNEKAELLERIKGLEKQLQEAQDREVALNLEAQEANQARADVSIEQEDFKKEADHWRKDAAEQAGRLKSAEQRLHQLEQRKLEDKAKIKALAEQLQAAVDAGFIEEGQDAAKRPAASKPSKKVKEIPAIPAPAVPKAEPSTKVPSGGEEKRSWLFGWLDRRPSASDPVSIPQTKAPKVAPKGGKAKAKGKKAEKAEKAEKTSKVDFTAASPVKVDDKEEAQNQKTQHAILAVLVLVVLCNVAWRLS